MRSRLVELGERTVSAVAANIAAGAPLAKCQLLASELYEAVQRELRELSSTDDDHRAALIAAASRCERLSTPTIGPAAMLHELGTVLATLESGGGAPNASHRFRPLLRLIKGGLSEI